MSMLPAFSQRLDTRSATPQHQQRADRVRRQGPHQHRPHGTAGLIAFQENGHAAPVLHLGHQKAVAAAAQTGSVQTGMGGQSGQPGQMPGGSFDPGSAPTPPSGDFRPGNRQ